MDAAHAFELLTSSEQEKNKKKPKKNKSSPLGLHQAYMIEISKYPNGNTNLVITTL